MSACSAQRVRVAVLGCALIVECVMLPFCGIGEWYCLTMFLGDALVLCACGSALAYMIALVTQKCTQGR